LVRTNLQLKPTVGVPSNMDALEQARRYEYIVREAHEQNQVGFPVQVPKAIPRTKVTAVGGSGGSTDPFAGNPTGGSGGDNPFGTSGGGSGTSSRTSSGTVAPSGGTTTPRVRVVDEKVLSEGLMYVPRYTSLGVDHPLAKQAGIPTDNDQPIVRVYALGSAIVDRPGESYEEKTQKANLVKEIQELISQTLGTAGLDNTSPSISFHRGLGVLVAKASMAQHEMIEQVVKALRESGAQAAQNPSAIPEPLRLPTGTPTK
jgi:hypothetical protein